MKHRKDRKQQQQQQQQQQQTQESVQPSKSELNRSSSSLNNNNNNRDSNSLFFFDDNENSDERGKENYESMFETTSSDSMFAQTNNNNNNGNNNNANINNNRSEQLMQLQKEELNNQREIESFYSQTIEILSNNLCFPNDYNLEYNKNDNNAIKSGGIEEDRQNDGDCYEAEFDNYRKDLDKVFKAMTRVAPDQMLHLINIRMQSIVNKLDSMQNTNNNNNINNNSYQWQSIEAALHMTYHIVKDYDTNQKTDDLVRNVAGFGSLFEMIMNCNAIGNFYMQNNVKIALTYLDVIHKYCTYFEQKPAMLGNALQIFIGNSGIKCKHNATLRARSTYLMSKMMPKLCSSMGIYMKQFAKDLIEAFAQCCAIYVKQRSSFLFEGNFSNNISNNNNSPNGNNLSNLINNNSNELMYGVDEVSNLCHTIGILILLENTNIAKQHAENLVGLFKNRLESFINSKNSYNNNNNANAFGFGSNMNNNNNNNNNNNVLGWNRSEFERMKVVAIMSEYIRCLQSFTKPFRHNYGFVANIFGECTKTVVACYEAIPNDNNLRDGAICFIHSAQEVLRNGIVDYLDKVFDVFIKYLNENNVVRTLQVFTNMVANLEKEIIPILNDFFTPLVKQVFTIINKIGIKPKDVGNTHEFEARIDIQKVCICFPFVLCFLFDFILYLFANVFFSFTFFLACFQFCF